MEKVNNSQGQASTENRSCRISDRCHMQCGREGKRKIPRIFVCLLVFAQKLEDGVAAD